MKAGSKHRDDGSGRLLPRLSLAAFDHARITAALWLALAVFGVVAYGFLLRREGFPAVNIPVSVISGSYLVNDAARVDREIAKPISDLVGRDERVSSVRSQARGVFYNVVVEYRDGADAGRAGAELRRKIEAEANLPARATLAIDSPQFGFTERGDDAVISLRSPQAATGTANSQLLGLIAEADQLTAFIKARNIDQLGSISLIAPLTEGANPASGLRTLTQSSFDRYAERRDGRTVFYESVAVGLSQKPGTDVIEFDRQLRAAVTAFNDRQGRSAVAVVSAGYAEDIKRQISELQKALLEGLLAVLLVGSLLIAIRASLVTVLSMLTVLAMTVGVLYAIGYTLNTITLFSLILCLGLIVDDTIIMVEAIDTQRRRLREARRIIATATRKVSRAMVAATLTAALSFAPLLFVGGVLGGFIRAIPVTVITSLLVSLLVALVFIPLFARLVLLGRRQMAAGDKGEPAVKLESAVAGFITRPMLWARHSTRRLAAVGASAVLIGLLFIGASVFLFREVTFNIFPASKDTNGLTVELRMRPGTTIRQAEGLADRADAVVAATLGANLANASYYANASDMMAALTVTLTPYEEREQASPELVEQLQGAFRDFEGAAVTVRQIDVGPPASDFVVQVYDGSGNGNRLADDVAAFLRSVELRRPSGEPARLRNVTVADPGVVTRSDGQAYVAVTGGFDANDTTTLVTLAQQAMVREFTAERLRRDYNLGSAAIGYNLGQEQSNQDSFAALLIAFPVLLLVIYLLLAVQFKSLIQPLLIFMAIPFSLFGVTLGLYLTDNPFSFFAALGFFALIGLSLKNTILLTDYANQLRRQGSGAVEAAAGALHERFRPLLATSLTAVVSLIPLALTSPFWEGLSIVLIGGLLSSTLLVVTVFPYYYLGVEFLRSRVGRPLATRLRRR